MATISTELRNGLVQAYLGYRLNNSELVDLVQRAESPEGKVEDTFASYSQRDVDWRGEVTAEQVKGTLQSLGLSQQLSALDQSKVWSAEQRALYRRLSRPEDDAGSQPAPQAPAPLDAGLVAAVEESFSSWDRDGNIRIEASELDYLMSGGYYGEKLEIANDPGKAAALATLLRYQDLLSAGNPGDGSGVSLSDLRLWSSDQGRIASGAMQAVNEVYQEYLERAHKLDMSKPLSQESIDPRDIHQGVVGSCVLLSTTIGTEPGRLQSMFAPIAGDGGYTVTFPDGARETVREPSLAERLHHSRGKDSERWPALIEIAAAQRLIGEGKRAPDGIRGVLDGIDPEFAIAALTGKPADKRSIDELSVAQTRDLLEHALSAGGPVICGSRPTANGDFINVEELHNGIVNGHCYSIQGFDPTTGMVKLQNPWHKHEWKHASDGADDGVFEMPLVDFYCSYRWITFASRPAEQQERALRLSGGP
jgi:hypothetical protein